MLQKQDININFSQGLDTKTDPKQIQPGKFLSLQNSVFTKAGLLQKRNGFGPLAPLPDATSTYLTTFNEGLTAIGTSLLSFSSSTDGWVNKGNLQLAELSTLPLIRSSTNQTQADAVVAPNGLVCTAYTDTLPSGTAYRYAIADSSTGQNVIVPTLITPTSGSVNSSPRVFLLDHYFIIAFGTSTNHIQYIAISTSNPTSVTAAVDITTSYVAASTISWDGVVNNNKVYFAFNSTSGGQSIKLTYINGNLGNPVTAKVFGSAIATMMSMCVDVTSASNPTVWAAYYDSASNIAKVLAVDSNLNTVLSPTTVISGAPLANITCTARLSSITVYAEAARAYGYDGSIATNGIVQVMCTQAGSVGSITQLLRSVGLASKAFLIGPTSYLLATYSSPTQPTYFLINQSGQIISRLAYSNGGGYYTHGLPGVIVNGEIAQMSYLIKDLIAGINKGTALPAGTPLSAVYSQTGINLVTFTIGTESITSAEIGRNLNISGGMLWSYDGVSPVEQGFNLWPDSVEATWSATGGSIVAKPDGSTNTNAYWYQVTYEWADNQGNVNRSAPSIPIAVTTTGSASTGSIAINVPTLRLTYKTEVKIVVYRWSVAQQIYYAIASPAATPTLNDTTIDYVTITDTLADASILGNPIIYTTGGVVEDLPGPATSLVTLFNNRLFLVDAEDTNLLWFSKQVIEATPVEMSDLLTIYIAPTTGAQGSTGPITAMSALDDKLILFKKDASYYINGIGPDNTGSNGQYSDAVFISSVVGCSNQKSIVFVPQGLMFQSDKGIWLLGRDLSTNYIGAPVEAFTQGALVKSALNIPGTNQVRFTMDSGITLMYDYFYGQWGTFVNIPAISSTIFEGMHTYITDLGQVFQETLNMYLDNTSPVLMAFTTGWINFAGVQGLERFYQMLLLGQYYSPFKLNVQLAFDYNPSIQQATLVTSDNFSPAWGNEPFWGSGSPWGGKSAVFEARINPMRQKVESFQITINEIYDPSFGMVAGAGLTMSGMNLTFGMVRGRRLGSAARTFG